MGGLSLVLGCLLGLSWELPSWLGRPTHSEVCRADGTIGIEASLLWELALQDGVYY